MIVKEDGADVERNPKWVRDLSPPMRMTDHWPVFDWDQLLVYWNANEIEMGSNLVDRAIWFRFYR